MTLHIIGTSGRLDFPDNLTSSEIYNKTGGNTGNLVFQYAVNKLILGEKKYYDWSFNPGAVNEQGGTLVIPAANFAHPSFDLTSWADKIERINIPIVVIGLGAQIFGDPKELKLKDGTLRFLKVLSEKSNSIWVRGYKTAEALSLFGIHNTEPLGCPSNFINMDSGVGKKILSRLKVKPDSITFCPTFYSYNTDFETSIFRYTADSLRAVIVQEPLKAIEYVRDAEKFNQQIDNSTGLGFLGAIDVDELRIFNKTKASFYDAAAWLEYSKVSDLCLGSRIHGASISWQAGVPTVVQAYDERIGELADVMGLPVQRVRGKKYTPDYDEWYQLINDAASLYDEKRCVLAQKAATYLNSYGLDLNPSFLAMGSISDNRETTKAQIGSIVEMKLVEANPVKSGFLERYNYKIISGWAVGNDESKPVVLSCYINNEFVLDIETGILRKDMSGNYGFSLTTPEWVKDAGAVKIDIRCKATGKSISNAPVIINLHPDESSKVLEGKDGYLFLTNDTNQTIDQIAGKKILSEQSKADWAEFFTKLKAATAKIGTAFIVAPCKEVIFEQYLPDGIVVSDERNWKQIESLIEASKFNKKFTFTYPLEELRDLGDSYPKGDTHWTYESAFTVLKTTLSKSLGHKVIDDFFKQYMNGYRDTYSHSDLVSKFGAICVEKRQIPKMNAYASMEVLTDNVNQNTGKTVRYSFPDAPVKMKCLVVHDSFGEWFTPFLSRLFSEVTFKWDSDINSEELSSYDYLIIERAERFLIKPSKFI